MIFKRLRIELGCARTVLALFAGAALVVLAIGFVVFALFGLFLYW